MSLSFAECNDIADGSYISDANLDANSDTVSDSISVSVSGEDSSFADSSAVSGIDLNADDCNSQSDDLELEDSDLVADDSNSDNSKGKSESRFNALKSNALGSSSEDVIGSSIASPSVLSLSNYVIIEDESYYGSSANPSIQRIINEAKAGSTIEFTGSLYNNLMLSIDKPLNIISKSGTVIKSIFATPVFSISQGGSVTNITGFTVKLIGPFVKANDVGNIRIHKNNISTENTALSFANVSNSKIENNIFQSFKTGISIQKSDGITVQKNRITPSNTNNVGISLENITGKKGVSILNNIISGKNSKIKSTGINIHSDVYNVFLKGNTISDWYVGINFANSVNNVTITNNTITKNGDGVIINGWLNNFNFTKNSVTNNARLGVLFDYDYLGAKSNPVFENNFFSRNMDLDMKSAGAKEVKIGRNFAKYLCAKINMKKFYIRTFKSGADSAFLVTDNQGNAVTDLPNFSATVNIGGKDYTIQFVNGKAYLKGSGGRGFESGSSLTIGESTNSLGQWGRFEEISLDEFNELIKEYLENSDSNKNQSSTVERNQQNSQNPSNSSSTNSSSSSGSGDSGVSEMSSSVNAIGSYASGSASSSPYSSASSSSSSSSSATAKTLSVDDETFRVIGVGGLVFLIILVIGLYYREDIKDMIEEE